MRLKKKHNKMSMLEDSFYGKHLHLMAKVVVTLCLPINTFY